MKIFGSDKAAFVCKVILVCLIFALTLVACISGALAVSGENVVSRYLPDVAETGVFKVAFVAAIAVSVLLLFVSDRKRNTKKDTGAVEAEVSVADVCDTEESEAGVSVADACDTEKSEAGVNVSDACDTEESDAGVNVADTCDAEASDVETVSAEASAVNDTKTAVGTKDAGASSGASRIICNISRYASLLPVICSLYVFYFALSDESLGSWGNATMVTAFITALFFLFKMVDSMRAWTVLCGFGVFAFGAIVIASLYLDHIIEINSDFKLLVQFGAAGVIIGVIADIRRALSRISDRWFISLKAIGFILCTACPAVIISLPNIEGLEFSLCYSVYSYLYLSCAVSFVLEIVSEFFIDRSRCI